MLFGRIVDVSREVSATRSRKKKIAALAAVIRELPPAEIAVGVSYLSGAMPQGRIGLGYAAVMKIEAPPTADSSLTLEEVDRALGDIAAASGKGSTTARHHRLGQLLSQSTAEEQSFLRRLIMGELRQGALEGIVVEAIASAAEVEAAAVRRAAMLSGDLGAVAVAALSEGTSALAAFDLQIGRPLQPMLAQICDGADEAVEQLGEALLDFKLDGARIQVHKNDEEVVVFSRNLREVTVAVPEVVSLVRALPARTAVLDGEVLALRPDGTPQTFQVTMRRFGRKGAAAALEAELPLSPFFFDLLHLDGQTLIDRPARERLEALSKAIPETALVPRLVTADAAEAETFLDESLRRGHEGLMAKSLASVYAAGSRGGEWLKIKPAHTLDLVVLAAEWGSGRRRGWLSNLHLGARNADGSFTMLGKTFKGMTDAMLAWQTQKLSSLEIGRDGHTVWVKPELVAEIAVNDIQSSPHYPGGLALRFARVKRYREDKRPDEADTIETVRAIHAGHTKKAR